MEITSEITQDYLLVRVKGASLDAKEASPFLKETTRLLNENGCPHLILDMKHLDFIDTSGLESLLSLYKKLSDQNKTMALVNVEKSIRTVLEMVSMDTVFPIFSSVDEAKKALA